MYNVINHTISEFKGYAKAQPYILQSLLTPQLKKSFVNFKKLKGTFSGKRCFIMGNGPSLNITPLEKLKDEFVWGFNKCYLLFERINWKPSFYTAVDTLVLPDIANELNQLTEDCKETLFFFPLKYFLHKMIKNRENIIWFNEYGMSTYDLPFSYFSTNPLYYVRTVNTVAITGLQLAVYMGFNPIYLVGCDTNYVIPEGAEASGEVRDIGTGEKIKGYEIISTFNNDPNHFDTAYFGTNAKWHAPNVNGMIFGYSMAKKICDELGVEVYNATIGGMLEVFPRVDFNTLFN